MLWAISQFFSKYMRLCAAGRIFPYFKILHRLHSVILAYKEFFTQLFILIPIPLTSLVINSIYKHVVSTDRRMTRADTWFLHQL